MSRPAALPRRFRGCRLVGQRMCRTIENTVLTACYDISCRCRSGTGRRRVSPGASVARTSAACFARCPPDPEKQGTLVRVPGGAVAERRVRGAAFRLLEDWRPCVAAQDRGLPGKGPLRRTRPGGSRTPPPSRGGREGGRAAGGAGVPGGSCRGAGHLPHRQRWSREARRRRLRRREDAALDARRRSEGDSGRRRRCLARDLAGLDAHERGLVRPLARASRKGGACRRRRGGGSATFGSESPKGALETDTTGSIDAMMSGAESGGPGRWPSRRPEASGGRETGGPGTESMRQAVARDGAGELGIAPGRVSFGGAGFRRGWKNLRYSGRLRAW